MTTIAVSRSLMMMAADGNWKGDLLTPEMVRVYDEEQGLCEFRGTIFEV